MTAALVLLALQVTWSAPEGCPSEDDFRARVEENLAGEPAAARAVRIDVRPDGAAWVVRIATDSGERELSGATCAEVADAAALIVALMLRDEPRATEPPRRIVPPRPAIPARRSAFSLRADLAAGGDTGTLPGIGGGLGTDVSLGWRSFAVELGASWWPARREGSASVGLRTLALRGCAWHACAGFEAGLLGAEAVGVTMPGAADVRWLAGTLGGVYRWNLRKPFAILGRAEVVVPIERPIFSVAGMDAHQPDAVTLRIFVGLALTIW